MDKTNTQPKRQKLVLRPMQTPTHTDSLKITTTFQGDLARFMKTRANMSGFLQDLVKEHMAKLAETSKNT